MRGGLISFWDYQARTIPRRRTSSRETDAYQFRQELYYSLTMEFSQLCFGLRSGAYRQPDNTLPGSAEKQSEGSEGPRLGLASNIDTGILHSIPLMAFLTYCWISARSGISRTIISIHSRNSDTLHPCRLLFCML